MYEISVSTKYPWLVAQNLEDEQQKTLDLFFCTLNNELPHYRCRIPGEQRIRGCFHGWLILSNHPDNNKWSLWNNVTSKIITLPTLILKDGKYKSIGECCLTAPPDDPTSILLLTRTNKSSFVFIRLNGSKRNKFRWTEMSYAYQIKRLTYNGKLLRCLTCCNGEVYAICTDGSFSHFLMHIDIVVKEKEVVINIMVFSSCPGPLTTRGGDMSKVYLRGSATELFYFIIYFVVEAKIPIDVYVYKSYMACINFEEREYLKYWDMGHITNLDDVTEDEYEELDRSEETWETIDDLKGAIFHVDLVSDHSVSYERVISSELGGFIHIRGKMSETIYSYHVKNDTITKFPIPSPTLPTSRMSISMWECLSMWAECRLKDDRGEAKCIVDSKIEAGNNNEILLRSVTDDGVKFSESHLLDAPFNILETIIEFCVGIEYMKFRATCKQCHLAAPLVKWCNDTLIRRLQAYSVESPWLMVVDKERALTFTDPMLGDNYFMKKSHISIINRNFYGSRFGWLLFTSKESNCLVFFNPFTNDIRELPEEEYYFTSLCFSAPPTSLDCLVVGFTAPEYWRVNILLMNQEKTWRTLHLGPDPHTVCFSSFYGRDLYALCKGGELIVINNLGKEDYSWKLVEAKDPKRFSTQYFLAACNQHLLLVSVGGEYGGPVEVFKFNESKQEWGKIDSVGKHMIYVCGTTCLCFEAKVPKMENKIFFPRLYNRKVVFYSLDTCRYHTFNGENLEEHIGGLFGTTYYLSHNAWIEPSWS